MARKVKGVRSSRLTKRLILPMVLIVFLYACVFLGMIWYGGVLDQLKANEVERIQQSINRKVDAIQEKLDSCWGDEESYGGLLQKCSGSDEVTKEIAQSLKKLLDLEEVSGTYVFYDNGSSLYLTEDAQDSVVGVYGEESLLTYLGASKSSKWREKPGDRLKDAPGYEKIQKAMETGSGAGDFDYACMDYSYCREGEKTITYTVPVLGGDKKVSVMVGVEISKKTLTDLISDDDIQGTYFVGVSDKDKNFIERVVSSTKEGRVSSFDRILEKENGIWLIGGENGVFTMGNEGAYQAPYVLKSEIDFYQEKSAYQEETWLVGAIVDKSELLGSVNRMEKSILTALLVASMIGLIAIYFMATTLTKPIARLVDSLNQINPKKSISLPMVHIYEIDRLSAAIERVSKEVEYYALRNSEILRMADIPVGIAEIDENSKEVFCTAKVFSLLGELEPKEDHQTISIMEFKKMIDKFKRGTVVFEEGPVDNDSLFCDNNVYKVYSGSRDAGWISFQTSEKNGHLVVVVSDVTDKVKEKLKLEYERDYDELSHLLNKQAFARETQKRLETETNPVGVMVMWDLDNLKTINDTYGHEYGDIYIKEAAKTFAYLEQHNGLVARRSGDEFFAYVSGNSQNELRELIHSIHDILRNVVIHLPGEKDMNISASAGMVWYPMYGTEYSDLIKKVDFTMYDIKRSHKGNVGEFNQFLYEKEAILLTGKDELNEILEQKKFNFVYQPVIDALTGEIYGYEALVRPKTETMHSPRDIIRVARAQNKVEELERVLWDATLNDFFRERKRKERLFINAFSDVSMEKIQFEKMKYNYRREDMQNVIMELMDCDYADMAAIQKKQEQMDSVGGKVALDEFGIEMSEDMEKLAKTMEFVKIGRELICEVDKDKAKQEEVKKLMRRLKEHDILIVAVGVETEGELRFVQKYGADFVQGFYLAKPSVALLEVDTSIKDKIRM